ncbi:hypothetical protein Anas_13410 [Armadillidium nasatum]|uniref:Uncharacterized protein n=1 Tax=Armadillidium nasatum TaxID=96803 RepID=A0A5N5T257_9CRUS|nr:hypothetical protein Anas_13410 [Armadillidium nasatum]
MFSEKKDKAADPAAAAELGLDNVGGIFVVMAGGGAVACVLACCEFTWKARKLAAEEGDSFMEELMKELRFIARCSENEKPVRKAKSPETDSSTFYSSSNNYDYSKK